MFWLSYECFSKFCNAFLLKSVIHSCSNHSNLEMEAECLTKTLSYLNLNSLSAPRTFQPQGVKQEKHIKKREILAFKSLLQEIQLKNLPSRKVF